MASSLLVSSPISPRCYSPASSKLSLTHFNKHLAGTLSSKSIQALKTSRNAQTPLRLPLSFSSTKTKPHLLRCFNSSANSYVRDKNLSLDSLSATISQLTLADFCKWSLIFVIGFLAARWVVNLLLNPFFWVYLSWLGVVWPKIFAYGIGVYGIYGLYKHLNGGANAIEQAGVIAFVLTWTTLVPPAFVNGFVDGWYIVYFFVYLSFFIFLNAFVRITFYRGLYPPRESDPKWDCSLPSWCTSLYCGALVGAHWLAAFEAPLTIVPTGGWLKFWGIWALILTSFIVNGHSSWYIGKYSQKLVFPTGVAQAGLYRWLRHPVYASTMLLLASYFISLQAPFSFLLVVAASFAYYEQKTKLEETMMVETFGEVYKAYMKKVRCKYIPFIY